MRKFLLTAALTAVVAISSALAGVSASNAAASPSVRARTAITSCYCPYYLGDSGERSDGSFGARTNYSTLSWGTPGHFIIKIYGYELTRNRLNDIEVYFDVNKANHGPEYRFADWLTADHDGYSQRFVRKIDTWNDDGQAVSCPKWTTHVNYASDIITLSIPRRCVGDPVQVRWNTETWHFTQYNPVRGYPDGDWAYQEFEPGYWVKNVPPSCC
jgi:hypothetical protein